MRASKLAACFHHPVLTQEERLRDYGQPETSIIRNGVASDPESVDDYRKGWRVVHGACTGVSISPSKQVLWGRVLFLTLFYRKGTETPKSQ